MTEDQRRLLFLCREQFLNWATDPDRQTVSLDQKLNRIMLGLADMCVAMAGGYKDDAS
jgi:hypothetical protein